MGEGPPRGPEETLMAKVWHRHRASGDDWIVDVRDRGGVRHRFTASTREKADLLLAQKTTEYQEPEKLLGDPEVTLDTYARQWLADVTAEGSIKPRTIESYRQLFNYHIAPTLGATRLRDLRRAHVKALLKVKREQAIKTQKKPAADPDVTRDPPRKLSKNTVRLIRACLSVILAEAVDDGLIDSNPATLPTRRRGKRKAAQVALRPLEEDELARLLQSARENDPEYFPLFLLLARTGLRPGEAFALEWADLDFTKRKISVERALSAGQVGTTKTGTAREVDMSQELAVTLSALYRMREAQVLKHKWGDVPELVFVNAQRGYLDESRVRKRFARALKAAGVGGHRLYDLRHSFASHLIAKAPITYVAAQLGHADSTTTLRWYARWLPKSGKSYVDSLDTDPTWHQAGTNALTGTDDQPASTENLADSLENSGATRRIRTDDLLITNQLLYQLS
jgi:integrase